MNVCRRSPETTTVFGVRFHNVTFNEAVEWIIERAQSRTPAYVATANMDFVMRAWRDPSFRQLLMRSKLVVADGMPIVKCSSLFGARLKERVTGSDLTPMLAEAARDVGLSVFALGGAPGVADQAMRTLQEQYPGLKVAGTYSPPLADIDQMDNDPILQLLEETRPDILLVAFGAPKQEQWVHQHLGHWQVPVAIGVGGTLDFIAGVQSRAPRWTQRAGLEWLWRMARNPRRLAARYGANLRFLLVYFLKLGVARGLHHPDPIPDAFDLALEP
jgi:N-acetylglucosaminyldiphosphoundecaprenol N-acetyl-beta-D-mannosaminyltransferase